MANFRDQKLEYYDSLGGTDRNTIDSIKRWVTLDFEDKYGASTPKGKYDVRLPCPMHRACMERDAHAACK